jgi:hypothetical protein
LLLINVAASASVKQWLYALMCSYLPTQHADWRDE